MICVIKELYNHHFFLFGCTQIGTTISEEETEAQREARCTGLDHLTPHTDLGAQLYSFQPHRLKGQPSAGPHTQAQLCDWPLLESPSFPLGQAEGSSWTS